MQIDIVDQNDNSPSVAMHTSQQQVDVTGEVVVEITEECEIGTNLVAFSAYDKDQGSNGKVVFQLLNQADHFVEFQDENSGIQTIILFGKYGAPNIRLYCDHTNRIASRRRAR